MSLAFPWNRFLLVQKEKGKKPHYPPGSLVLPRIGERSLNLSKCKLWCWPSLHRLQSWEPVCLRWYLWHLWEDEADGYIGTILGEFDPRLTHPHQGWARRGWCEGTEGGRKPVSHLPTLTTGYDLNSFMHTRGHIPGGLTRTESASV